MKGEAWPASSINSQFGLDTIYGVAQKFVEIPETEEDGVLEKIPDIFPRYFNSILTVSETHLFISVSSFRIRNHKKCSLTVIAFFYGRICIVIC